jgi:hypothetical protein
MSAMPVQGQHDAHRRHNPANTMQPAPRICPSSVTETSMYPRARLDALSDAIFGVAMTLLVLDLRLPDEFHPAGAQELLEGFYHLVPKFIPYFASCAVEKNAPTANIASNASR